MKWEILAGLLSGVATAPLVSIVDQAIFCNASGKATVMESLKTSFSTLLRSPGQFFRGPTFLWIWAVYGATYAVSNTTERALIDRGQANASSSVTKFAASSGTNVGIFFKRFTKPCCVPSRYCLEGKRGEMSETLVRQEKKKPRGPINVEKVPLLPINGFLAG